ncbi:MAG: Hsp20/alpha crystallin family protein [Cyanobacteria bacterium P01_F01_bin.42]
MTIWALGAELTDQGNAYQLKVYLPGVSADGIDVQVTQESISITGIRKIAGTDGDRVFYSKFAYDQFMKHVKTPSVAVTKH